MDSKKPIPLLGLTAVVDPDDPLLDVVFVHGFTGHPERTWTHKNGDAKNNSHDENNDPVEPPPKIPKLNPFSRSHQAPKIYWPRDLLPSTIPRARVLTYGYDTHIRPPLGPPVSQNTVYDIACDFLVALEAERRVQPSRPILFIAHSLGGIIVKEMLRRSSRCRLGQAHLHGIFESTSGIIFFGTPHAGADPRSVLHRIAERAIKAAGFSVNEQIVSTLLPSAERLKELRDEFGPTAQEQNWAIHSFQEQIGVRLLNNHKVVDDTSSYLNAPAIEVTEHIGRDHMGMCRFTGIHDVEYKKVAAALHRMTGLLNKASGSGGATLDENRKQDLVDSLRFDQIDARQMTIKNAHAKTCKWLLIRPEYLDWLDPAKVNEHHGFLWIKGKPGTGKSTLMKFVLYNARRRMKERIIINFFFNARGDDLEKSTTGMYRSLLLQLLERIPALQCVFESLGSATHHNVYPRWSIESLKGLFEQAVRSLGQRSVLCLIDALDECDEDQIRDMVSFFGQLGNLAVSMGLKFGVCFSSRHYPHITIERGLKLILEGQEGHNEDITNYVNSELKVGRSKLAETIRSELQEKAAGVFMWVVLVVGIINKEHDGGRVHALRRRLQDIPSDLHELFRNILTRDEQSKDELLLCIQWVLFARKQLTPEQLYSAILSGAEPEALAAWGDEEITAADIERFILSSSKGLAEITKSNAPKVQFIHESVTDFLLKKNGLAEIWPDLGNDLKGQSHESLKQCCREYIGIAKRLYPNLGEYLRKTSSRKAHLDLRQSVTNAFPLLEYAVQNMLYHADAAESFGTSQNHFLRHFQLSEWVGLDNLFEKYESRRHTPNVSLLYILAEHNLSSLSGIDTPVESWVAVEKDRYGCPLIAALATSSHQAFDKAIQAMEKAQVAKQSSVRSTDFQDLPLQERGRPDFGIGFKFTKKRTILSYFAGHGDGRTLSCLLGIGMLGLDEKNRDGSTPLSLAVRRDHEDIIRLLLNRGANIESLDQFGQTPMHTAAERGHAAIVQLLLDRGANIETKNKNGETPLSLAAKSGHATIVELLLDRGANIETKDNNGRTLLSIAAGAGRDFVVTMLLLAKRANIESPDKFGQAPIHRAAKRGNAGVIQLLLNEGINIETRDKNGRTPLSLAAECAYGPDSVRLLLAKGADVEARDNDNQAPICWAIGNGNFNDTIVEELLDGGADIESRDQYGRTPLFQAISRLGEPTLLPGIRNRPEGIVRLLINRGANVDAKHDDGLTPVLLAERHGLDESLLRMLRDKQNIKKDQG
ncbi:hypothetical protein AAE478_007367 [Parahypoxylon ruwenzoriense]